jgi:hypothetical protein
MVSRGQAKVKLKRGCCGDLIDVVKVTIKSRDLLDSYFTRHIALECLSSPGMSVDWSCKAAHQPHLFHLQYFEENL